MTTRRGFLQGILAAGVAPWVCTTAGVLMPVHDLWRLPERITIGDLGFVVGDIITIAELDTARQRYIVTSVVTGEFQLRRVSVR